MSENKTPAIRFQGFMDEWKQYKFSELYKKSSEKNDGSIGMDKNITVATMQYKEDIKVSTDEYLNTYYTFNVGDIAFEGHQNKEFRFGRFIENDIGDGIVSHIFGVFRPIVDYDLHFWKYAINNEYLMRGILSRSTKASTMMHDLVTDDFLNESFYVPCLNEQKKIGSYLNNLDEIIALHQRKLTKLQLLKKSMLTKMFPKDGARVPEIRFQGFHGNWEHRKISEMFKITRGYVLPTKYTIDIQDDINKYPVFSSQTANNGLMGYYKDYLYENAITWTTDGANAGTVRYRRGKFYCTNVCGVLLSDNITASKMIAEALNQVAKKYVSYVGNPKLMNNVMADIVISLPQDKEEQDVISKYFEMIDYLILLQQRKLSKLQQIKQAMLSKLFV